MAPRSKKAAAQASEPEFASYAERELTGMQQDYADWIEEVTGYEVDPTSVMLAVVLRTKFQNSDARQESIAARKAEREAEAAEREQRLAEATKPRKGVAKKTAAGKRAKAAPVEDEVEDEVEEAPAAKPAARKRAAKKVTAPRRRRAAAPAADEDSADDFE